MSDHGECTQKLPKDNPTVVAYAKFKESDVYTQLVSRSNATAGDLWVVFYSGWKAASSDSENCAVA